MLLSMRITPYLPYLRRFARAVSGSQDAGDACVSTMLEALIADINLFPQTSNDRISVYRLFTNMFDKALEIFLEKNTERNTITKQKAWFSSISSLASRERQAFLLVAVEGFNKQEAAEILNVEPEVFEILFYNATRSIFQHVATRVMIIEDEPLIAMDIEHIVLELGHQVTGIARTHAEAIQLYDKEKPGIILADIQLADGSSGIDAINDILKKGANIPVIFITAFPERFLTGNKPEPTFLVTKPFNPEMVKALISQALFFQERKNFFSKMEDDCA